MAGDDDVNSTSVVQEDQELEIENGTRGDTVEDLAELVSTGKRHMACGDYPQAVEVLASACEILAAKHGDQSDELAEPYFQYGKALLELGRTENGVLGNALDGVTAEEENEDDLSESEQFGKGSQVKDEERDEVREQVYDAMSAENRTDEKTSSAKSAGAPDGTEKEDAEKTKDTTEDKSSGDTSAEGKTGDTSAEDKTGDTSAEDKTGDTSAVDKTEDTSAVDKTEDTSVVDKTEDKPSESSEGTETTESKTETNAESGTEVTEAGSAANKTADGGADDETAEGSSADDATPDDGPEDESMEDGDEDTNSSQDEENMDADDVPNLQLSWEVLELSKKIYENLCCDKPELKCKLADVYMSLGEVAVESESYEQAVADFNSCLDLQKTCMEEHDRLIAETHYQLGVTHSLSRDYKLAVEQLNTAKQVLESRITYLESRKSSEDLSDKTQSELYEKELLEVKQLIPDIVSKIEDAVDELKNSEKVVEKVKSVLAGSATNENSNTQIGFTSSSSNDAPASVIAVKKPNDISNLVRKRKPEDAASETAEKKTKQNGDAPVKSDVENQVS